MARIAGVDIPREKRLEIALTYIFGIGRSDRPQDLRRARARPRHPGPHADRRRGQQDPHLRRRQPQGRGRPAPRRPAGHQAQDGDRLLGRPPPPQGPPRPRPAHPDQRPHPQGPEEDRRRQEEGQEVAMAKPKPGGRRPRKRERKNVTYGVAHIKSSFNNTIVVDQRPGRATSSPGRRPATSASRAPASRRRSPPRWPPRPAPGGPWSTASARST